MFWRLLASVVALLPWRALRVPGSVLGWLAGSVLRVRRRHALASLDRAGVADARTAFRAMYSSLGTLVFELLWTAARSGHPVTRFFEQDLEQWDNVERALARGRGLVVATAHTGNWDLLACAMAARVPLMVVTRHLSWPSLDAFWQQMRARRGVTLVDAEGAIRRAAAHLREGGVVAFLIDQRPLREKGTLETTFLGQTARHDLAFAEIAARYRAPVAIAFAERLGGGRHRLRLASLLEPPARPSKAWTEYATVQAAAELERFVLACPGQWLWLHRRWVASDSAASAHPKQPGSIPAA